MNTLIWEYCIIHNNRSPKAQLSITADWKQRIFQFEPALVSCIHRGEREGEIIYLFINLFSHIPWLALILVPLPPLSRKAQILSLLTICDATTFFMVCKSSIIVCSIKKTVKVMHSKARLSYCIEGEITSKIQYTTHHRLLLFILIARVKTVVT